MGSPQTENVLNIIPKIVIFGKPDCKFCENAKNAFASVELPFDYKMLEEELCIGEDPETGDPRCLPKDWKTNGMIDLLAMWSFHSQPVPLILVDGKSCKNLSEALNAVGYRERKKIIVARKRDAAKADSQSDA